jgi:hypothetical protein
LSQIRAGAEEFFVSQSGEWDAPIRGNGDIFSNQMMGTTLRHSLLDQGFHQRGGI